MSVVLQILRILLTEIEKANILPYIKADLKKWNSIPILKKLRYSH